MRLFSFSVFSQFLGACLAAGCTTPASSNGAGNPEPCAFGDCPSSDGGPSPVDGSRGDGAVVAPRDAAVADTGPSGAVINWDGSRPPYDGGTGVPVRDAAWEDGGVVGPGGPVLPGDPPNRAICSNAGPLGFSTQTLTATSLPRGSTDPITAPWATAAQRTGAPGPALILVDNLGILPAGGIRAVRVGAPRSTGGSSPFGFLQIANNPVATNWSLTNMYGVAADTTASTMPAGTLRLKAASGANVDIPFVAVKLDGRFVIEQTSEACTHLQVGSLAFFIAESAGTTLLEGQALSTLLGTRTFTLGTPAGTTTYWRITLSGAAPVVSLQASP